MTTQALWSGLSYPSGAFAYSSNRLTLTSLNTGGRLNGFVGQALTSGVYYWEITNTNNGGGAAIGVADTATSLTQTGGNPLNCFVVASGTGDGRVFNIVAGSGTVVATLTDVTGTNDVYGFLYDTGTGSGSSGTKQCSINVNGGAFAGPFATPEITTGTPIWQIYNAESNVAVLTSLPPYVNTFPSGAVDLPATLAASPPSAVGTAVLIPVPWTDGNLSAGLNYSLNGGAWTACGGTVSGSAGTATAGTLASVSFNTIAFQDATLTIDQTTAASLASLPVPSGVGPLLFAASGHYTPSNLGNETFIFPEPQDELFFAMSYQNLSFGITGTTQVVLTDENNVSTWSIDAQSNTTGTLDVVQILNYGIPGSLPLTGTGTTTIVGNLVSVGGVIDATSIVSGRAAGTVTVVGSDGGTSQYGTTGSPVAYPPSTPPDASPRFGTLTYSPNPLFSDNYVAVAFYGPVPPPPAALLNVQTGM